MGLPRTYRIEQGSVHGRFQPLHNAHLDYILEAKKRCNFLWIGITKYDITGEHLNPLGRHRERPEATPLTYFERLNIIRVALIDSGISAAEFAFVPFPIETPAALPLFLPRNITCFTTICEDWNREKILVLEASGYIVEVLWERTPKTVNGTHIRKSIAEGTEDWKHLVPPATVKAVEQLALRSRLQRLFGDGR